LDPQGHSIGSDRCECLHRVSDQAPGRVPSWFEGRRPNPAAHNEEAVMQWQTPKIVEIACGCEINAYFPADL